MKEVITTLTSKGQVTILVEVRRHLGLDMGDKVAFVIDDEGTVQLRIPDYPTVASLRGAAGTLAASLSWQEMREIAREDREQGHKVTNRPAVTALRRIRERPRGDRRAGT